MKNLLFVSIAFPPKNDPECLQTSKYFKYLVRDPRLSITVVTSAIPTLNMDVDTALEKFAIGFKQQITIPVWETKLTNFILRKILPGGIDYPDSKFSFHWQAKRVIRKVQKKPDVIYSRSNPLSSALLAYKLKQYYQVPWIMHLSDPWVGSPVHAYRGRQLLFHQQWERECIRQAEVVALTSEATIEFYGKRYPQHAHKFKFFPNVYDPDDIQANPIKCEKKLKLVYTGGLSGQRSPEFFIRACEELFKEDRTIVEKFEAVFAGPMDRVNKLRFDATTVPMIKHIGTVPFNKALEIIRKAHVLVTIDLPIIDPSLAMFFPSKILDYFLAKRRILALTTAGSATERALKHGHATILMYDHVEGIKQFIKQAVAEHENRNADFFEANEIPLEFSARENAGRLANLICA